MVPFEGSPVGEKVNIVRSKSREDETNQITKDLEQLLSRGIEPTDILILTNKTMSESSIKPIEKVSGVAFEWTGRKPNKKSKCIQVSNINNFKGLEAPVILVVDFLIADVETRPEYLYTQASRAKNILNIYLN